jgi:hypothetical protein
MGESELPSAGRSADTAAQSPPPEWGKERPPILGKIVAAVVTAVCFGVVAGIAVWGFDLVRSVEATDGGDRPGTVHEAAPSSSVTATPRGANEADVGDCVEIVKGGVDAELAVVGCRAADARYRVALELEMQEECPAGPYLKYETIGPGGWSLCLALNARAGQCFRNSAVDGFILTKCAAAEVKVVKVLAGKADQNACPPPPPNVLFYPEPMVYPAPPLTICLAHVAK